MLKHFKVDPKRTRLVVPVEFYQMNLIRAVQAARKEDPDLFVDGDDLLPSWTKFGKDVIRGKSLWTRVLGALFDGQGNLPEMDVDFQTNTVEDMKVAMMFLPGSMTNVELTKLVTITQQKLSNWKVIEISGAGTHNGKKITNKNAEKITHEVIEEAKQTNTSVLILSRGMAQRSYSVGEITSLYLCYDEGDAGATTQKISRALTPSKEGKIGRIFSLSFDPNRDDKFDTMMIAAAQNYAKRKGVDVDEALRRVIATMDIFSTSPDGRIDIDHDTYLKQILDRNSLSRMVGKQADMDKLSFAEIEMLAKGNYHSYAKLQGTDKAARGKTGIENHRKSRKEMSNAELKVVDKARKTLTTIVDHLPYLAFATNTTTVRDSLEACNASDDYRQYVTEEFGVTPQMMIELFDRGVINYDLASLNKTGKALEIEQQMA